ncbi:MULTISPECIES: hypothetical protein [Sorangium]|uniref:AAA+ ATPase domain-containing protein n=1 Tax=Sorangium cellulosum TaxID=56 RepID=A0A4P2QZ28_SORCE|nr:MULTISPECIES: hypothetical protein [Sorangium]AUX35566.1 hypothetical protein SOCE836_077600 [Sorangium cellulosum]WCQ94866.1 hypothetical protein NQZ70_07637 [Sorangium sp. Soce836]
MPIAAVRRLRRPPRADHRASRAAVRAADGRRGWAQAASRARGAVVASRAVLLSRVRLAHVGPFDDLSLSFEDADGAPRRLVVLFGGDGVGKTSILSAIASTRPGYAVAQLKARGDDASPPLVVTDWMLGTDDPARAHPLRVASPNARLDEPEDAALLRRREQALFERRAAEGGFVLVALSGARWFSRTAIVLTTPERSILRYDVRAAASFDDATRTDLARETKQVLSFLPVAAAIARDRAKNKPEARPDARADAQAERLGALERALKEVLDALLEGHDAAYVGVDPLRLEPIFERADGQRVDFDDLGRSARHTIAFGALALRALASAHPTGDPRLAEGVVLIDDIEAQQPAHRQRSLAARLRAALPNVQWIVTTASPAFALGCELSDVIALRREPSSGRVEPHEGPDAVLH